MKTNLTFLLVNESATIRKVWRQKLIQFQAEIIEAASAEEALAIFESHSVSLIIADCQLSPYQGKELVSLVRQLSVGAHTGFVMVQPRSNQKRSETAYEAGANLVLTQNEEEATWHQSLAHLLKKGENHVGSLILVVDDSPALLG